MMNTKVTKSYPALDIGKFLCAILILFYHEFTEHGPVPVLLEEALSLYAVAVALFMTISGFLVFGKINEIKERAERWYYVKKQVKRIFKIYLLWSIPYVLYQILRWDFETINAVFVFWKIQGWIFKTTFSTIWFLFSLAIGILLTFFVTEYLPKKASVILAVLMYIIGAMMSTYSFIGQMIPGFDAFRNFANIWLAGSRGGIFYAFPLIMLGRLFAKKMLKINWKIWGLLSISSTAILLAEALIRRNFAGNTGIDNDVMLIPIAFCILGFLTSIDIPNGGYAMFLRKMSVLIFVTQRIFLTVIPSLLPSDVNDIIFTNVYVGAVFVCGGTILFSLLIIILSNKINWLRNLY